MRMKSGINIISIDILLVISDEVISPIISFWDFLEDYWK